MRVSRGRPNACLDYVQFGTFLSQCGRSDRIFFPTNEIDHVCVHVCDDDDDGSHLRVLLLSVGGGVWVVSHRSSFMIRFAVRVSICTTAHTRR